MTKTGMLALTIGAATLALTSCDNNKGGIKRTSEGLQYRMVKDEPGDKHPAVNDIIEMDMRIHIGDSMLFNSLEMNGGNHIKFPLQGPSFKGDWLEGISLLTPGDSAIFYMSVDTIKKYNKQGQFPEWAKSGDTIMYEVNMVGFESAEDIKKQQEEASKKQMQEDDEKLQAYFKEKGLHPEKTSSGLYYIIDKQGSGPEIEKGQKVTVNYTGTNLDGKPFDSNVDPQFQHTDPFSFPVGLGQVITGWDEGIMLLKKGSKARFFIPSPLAYGQRDMGPDMGPNAILVFDVEVTGVSEAPDANTVQ